MEKTSAIKPLTPLEYNQLPDEEKNQRIIQLAMLHIPQFSNSTLDEFKVTSFDNATSSVRLVSNQTFSAVYKRNRFKAKHGEEDTVPYIGHAKTAFKTLIKRKIMDTEYFYVAPDLVETLSEYLPGVHLLDKRELMTPEVLKIAAKKIAIFANKMKGIKFVEENSVIHTIEKGKMFELFDKFWIQKNNGEDLEKGTKGCWENGMIFLKNERNLKVAKELSRENCEFTVNHNDSHFYNMLFDQSKNELTLIDFEFVRDNPVCYDLAYMILFSCSQFMYDKKCFEFFPDRWIDDETEKMLLREYLSSLEIELPDWRDPENFQRYLNRLKKLYCLILMNLYLMLVWFITLEGGAFNFKNAEDSLAVLARFLEEKYFKTF